MFFWDFPSESSESLLTSKELKQTQMLAIYNNAILGTAWGIEIQRLSDSERPFYLVGKIERYRVK